MGEEVLIRGGSFRAPYRHDDPDDDPLHGGGDCGDWLVWGERLGAAAVEEAAPLEMAARPRHSRHTADPGLLAPLRHVGGAAHLLLGLSRVLLAMGVAGLAARRRPHQRRGDNSYIA